MMPSNTACLVPGQELTEALDRTALKTPVPVLPYRRPIRPGESLRLQSLGVDLAGKLFLPDGPRPAPVLIICHGAGDWKENYFELCEFLAERGLASLALDMHGHGQSGGERFCVNMREWIVDVRAALDYVASDPRLDASRIAAFGLSSGGTAILEAAVSEPRLKALVALDATVRDSLPRGESWFLRALLLLGKAKRSLTHKGLRLPLGKLSPPPQVASDPEINRQIVSNPLSLEAFMDFPLPGGEEAFLVNTIQRVSRIAAPTLVLWGADDQVDPPQTAYLLFRALTCKKALQLVPGNGHLGHLDRNREKVFELTADWLLRNFPAESVATIDTPAAPVRTRRVISHEAAQHFGREEKWELLSPFIRAHGREALAYATLQDGMEYFIDETGYIAYTTVRHPVFARRPKRIVLSDPVCAPEDLPKLIEHFLAEDRRALFGVISEPCAEVLRAMGFKINCAGYEPELPIQTYNTQGNWKELDLIKRARNEVRREGIVIREEDGASLRQHREELAALSAKWISSKKINDREIWIYARRPIFDHEPDVRKFVAYDREGRVCGFVFYDPMYRHGEVYGYSANIVRCDEQRFGRLATAVHMAAIEKFRTEGKETFNLLLAPFVKLERGKYNDDLGAKLFLSLSARFGNDIYNFKGLSFHKSKYRGVEKPLYIASNSLMVGNDLYLAYQSADVTHSYFTTLGQLLWGMISAFKARKSE